MPKKKLFDIDYFDKTKHKPIPQEDFVTKKLLDEDLKSIKRLDENTLALAITKLLSMSMDSIIKQASNPGTIALYRVIAKMIVEVANTGNARIFKELMDRTTGKVVEVVDMTTQQVKPVYRVVMQDGQFLSERPVPVEREIVLDNDNIN